MKKITNLILISLLFISCQPEGKQQNIIVDNKYSISIPAFLKKVNNLNKKASLQYQHVAKEFYIISLDEPKTKFYNAIDNHNMNDLFSKDLEGYMHLVCLSIKQNSSNYSDSEVLDTLINGLPAKLLTISAHIEGSDLFYSLAFIEGKSRYYQIVAWTLLSKENQYKDKMSQIMYSFKEL